MRYEKLLRNFNTKGLKPATKPDMTSNQYYLLNQKLK